MCNNERRSQIEADLSGRLQALRARILVGSAADQYASAVDGLALDLYAAVEVALRDCDEVWALKGNGVYLKFKAIGPLRGTAFYARMFDRPGDWGEGDDVQCDLAVIQHLEVRCAQA